jgi:hypothetical protein
LEIYSALVTVNEFDLVILPEYLNRKCRVAWRKPQSIGVRFVSAGDKKKEPWLVRRRKSPWISAISLLHVDGAGLK